MADRFTYLHGRLDTFHDAISIPSQTSTDAELEKFATYLSPQGEFYLGGMNVPPVTSREEAIAGMWGLLSYWCLNAMGPC
jgi:hypothetical protein